MPQLIDTYFILTLIRRRQSLLCTRGKSTLYEGKVDLSEGRVDLEGKVDLRGEGSP